MDSQALTDGFALRRTSVDCPCLKWRDRLNQCSLPPPSPPPAGAGRSKSRENTHGKANVSSSSSSFFSQPYSNPQNGVHTDLMTAQERGHWFFAALLAISSCGFSLLNSANTLFLRRLGALPFFFLFFFFGQLFAASFTCIFSTWRSPKGRGWMEGAAQVVL